METTKTATSTHLERWRRDAWANVNLVARLPWQKDSQRAVGIDALCLKDCNAVSIRQAARRWCRVVLAVDVGIVTRYSGRIGNGSNLRNALVGWHVEAASVFDAAGAQAQIGGARLQQERENIRETGALVKARACRKARKERKTDKQTKRKKPQEKKHYLSREKGSVYGFTLDFQALHARRSRHIDARGAKAAGCDDWALVSNVCAGEASEKLAVAVAIQALSADSVGSAAGARLQASKQKSTIL